MVVMEGLAPHVVNSLLGIVSLEELHQFPAVLDEELDGGLQGHDLDLLVGVQQIQTKFLVFPENFGQKNSLFLELHPIGRTDLEEAMEALIGELFAEVMMVEVDEDGAEGESVDFQEPLQDLLKKELHIIVLSLRHDEPFELKELTLEVRLVFLESHFELLFQQSLQI